VKEISGAKFYRTMDPSGAWYSADSSTVSVNDVLSNQNRDVLIAERGGSVTVKFTPDSGGSNGQGYSVPGNFQQVKVTAVTGTVYILRAEYVTLNTKKTDAYGNANKVAVKVDDILYLGDMIVCAKDNSDFTAQFCVGYSKWCDQCWAVRFCDKCLTSVGVLNEPSRLVAYCDMKRNTVLRALSTFVYLVEKGVNYRTMAGFRSQSKRSGLVLNRHRDRRF
jgi:hypothetical protein